jgi:hypothetical protein
MVKNYFFLFPARRPGARGSARADPSPRPGGSDRNRPPGRALGADLFGPRLAQDPAPGPMVPARGGRRQGSATGGGDGGGGPPVRGRVRGRVPAVRGRAPRSEGGPGDGTDASPAPGGRPLAESRLGQAAPVSARPLLSRLRRRRTPPLTWPAGRAWPSPGGPVFAAPPGPDRVSGPGVRPGQGPSQARDPARAGMGVRGRPVAAWRPPGSSPRSSPKPAARRSRAAVWPGEHGVRSLGS